MELPDILNELETLLTCNSIDEGWSGWLEECADKTTQHMSNCERTHLLHQIRESEMELSHLRAYFLSHDENIETMRQKLDSLVHALDVQVQQELNNQ